MSSLTIHLEEQPPHYSGGETIRGQIVLQCFNVIELQEVRVTFSGRAEAKIRKVKGSAAPSGTYRGKCVLFEKERILVHPGGHIAVTGTYTWPFEFVFPSHVETIGQSLGWPEKPPFRSDLNHPLPPTFAVKMDDALREIDCVVEYQIRAEVFTPQRGLLGTKSPFTSETMRLHFEPPSLKEDLSDTRELDHPSQHQKEQFFNIRSMLLLQEYKGRTLTVQEKFRSWLFPGQLPRFSFRVSFSYPIRMSQPAPLACYLNIEPIMEDSSVSSPPVILLQSLHIILVGITSARSSPSLMGTMSGEVKEHIEILSKRSLGMPVSGKIDLCQVFGPLVFRPTDVSFATFNISRMYRLCVLGSFDCAGKRSEFEVSDIPVDIIPKAKETMKSSLVFDDSHKDEFPPSYEPSSTPTS